MNTILSSLDFLFEFRNLPHDAPEQISQAIEEYISIPNPRNAKEFADVSVNIEPMNCIPAFQASKEIKWIEILAQKDRIKKVSYATEAGLFQKAAIPTIVCGPGSIMQAHKANIAYYCGGNHCK